MAKIKKALISVSDKRGIVEFARALNSMGVEIISTGGTRKALVEAGIPALEISEYTGFPEMLEGRLKTLHPKVHGGLLAKRDNPQHMEALKKHGIGLIDMVVVNLYPFETVTARPDVTFDEAIENIDIGGPTMLRSAAKNFKDVAVIVDPDDYNSIIDELRTKNGELSYETKLRLAKKVFAHTARYDAIISSYLERVTGETFPPSFIMPLKRVATLRYGENPHQKACLYSDGLGGLNLVDAEILQGKEMSFNNYLDAHAALMLALEFDRPACAIIKHNNPCGVAIADTAKDAYVKACKTDPVSAFGGVLAFNIPVDGPAAEEIIKLFVEVIIAPDFDKRSKDIFSQKPNIRLLRLPDMKKPLKGWEMKRIAGGMLIQDWDTMKVDVKSLKAVTRRQPTPEEYEALEFAWRVVKHVKSNSIVYALKDRTVGIGIGQTSRVYSAKIGAMLAQEPVKGCVAASDGFFPFRDGIDVLHNAGVTAVIQPGGSLKDDEVIKAADEHGMAMLITGVRHFRH
ncbi:MAG: bifunctional phosphoribosylaminoimidazolecarboxamide formyltransferase/IMP cyclohydrolase [Thermodesulfovibrionales bacterium]